MAGSADLRPARHGTRRHSLTGAQRGRAHRTTSGTGHPPEHALDRWTPPACRAVHERTAIAARPLPDPVSTGSIAPSDTACVNCGLVRGYIYKGPVYAAYELDGRLCRGASRTVALPSSMTVWPGPPNLPTSRTQWRPCVRRSEVGAGLRPKSSTTSTP
ncbi:CbrC family protein [Streptomyces sp. NPDC002730]|uniref:CbrC family protein n=1 Tax=Streptomyces sp. NPDC002730 TaxID=3364662 RepID=UPI0036B7BF39